MATIECQDVNIRETKESLDNLHEGNHLINELHVINEDHSGIICELGLFGFGLTTMLAS